MRIISSKIKQPKSFSKMFSAILRNAMVAHICRSCQCIKFIFQDSLYLWRKKKKKCTKLSFTTECICLIVCHKIQSMWQLTLSLPSLSMAGTSNFLTDRLAGILRHSQLSLTMTWLVMDKNTYSNSVHHFWWLILYMFL